MRKLLFTQFFILIGLIHIIIFLLIKDNGELYFEKGHSGKGLNYTIIAILLIQILRYLSLKIQQKELVFHTSLSDEGKMLISFVVAEKLPNLPVSN